MADDTSRQPGTEPWIDPVSSRASRRIFSDPQVFALEIERIFNRSWLYLGHESEISRMGDYVTRPMGSDHVIVSRGEDGMVRAFLNACRHRGMQLCRADAGSARRFVCPYHAWTYDTTGALRSTSFDQHYTKGELSRLALTPVPKLECYRGMIFGNWDEQATPLDEHLGDLKWYLDMMFGRTPGGMTVLGPPQRWVVETNWKIPPLNFMDTQHAIRTHRGPMTMAEAAGAPPLQVIAKMADAIPQLSFPQGHGIVLSAAGGDSSSGLPQFFGHPPEAMHWYEKILSPEQFIQFKNGPPGVGTMFPNTSWIEPVLAVAADKPPTSFLALRNWQPLSVDQVEIWSWYFAEAEALPETRAEMHRMALQTFGIGGIFEEDDAEVWAAISRMIQGPIASRQHMHFDAGRDTLPMKDFTGRGIAYPSLLTEHAQFGFIKRWNELMQQNDTERPQP